MVASPCSEKLFVVSTLLTTSSNERPFGHAEAISKALVGADAGKDGVGLGSGGTSSLLAAGMLDSIFASTNRVTNPFRNAPAADWKTLSGT